jgi:hypothetical protein
VVRGVGPEFKPQYHKKKKKKKFKRNLRFEETPIRLLLKANLIGRE